MLFGVFQGIAYFLEIIRYVLLAYCLLSWILPPHHKVMRALGRFVDPVLFPVRQLMYRLLPRIPLDLSALLAFFVLQLLQSLLWRLYGLLA